MSKVKRKTLTLTIVGLIGNSYIPVKLGNSLNHTECFGANLLKYLIKAELS